MTAMAARSLGYAVHVLDPDAECPAAAVADRCVTASFEDAESAADLARYCDVVTFEIEQIGVDALAAAGRHAVVRPSPDFLGIVQNRSTQKAWLRNGGFPIGDYREIANLDDLERAARAMGPLFVKANRGGYDGRSQVRVEHPDAANEAWSALGERPSIAERAIDLQGELSVMVARAPSGELRTYPPALNHHDRQVLAWSVIPAPVAPHVADRAKEIAVGIATEASLEGLLAVELFLTRGGELLVNELAPRPHNSFHETERACSVSQFEQLVRAICDLPLGSPAILQPAAIVNLFGDLWIDGQTPSYERALSMDGIRLHLYGKRAARSGRKMGHLSGIGGSAADALELVQEAAARLRGRA